MYWLKELYLGESVREKEKEIRKKLRTNAGQVNVHILAIAQSPTEQIDIIPAFTLMQRGFPQDELYVFGLAGKKSEAFSLVRDLAEETVKTTGGADMRAFLEAKEFVFEKPSRRRRRL